MRVVHEDTRTEPQASVQAARKVIAEGASCLTGAWASADTIPVAHSVAKREDVPQISPASTSDQITELQDEGLISRTVPLDFFQGPALAAAIEQDLGSAEGKVVKSARATTPMARAWRTAAPPSGRSAEVDDQVRVRSPGGDLTRL